MTMTNAPESDDGRTADGSARASRVASGEAEHRATAALIPAQAGTRRSDGVGVPADLTNGTGDPGLSGGSPREFASETSAQGVTGGERPTTEVGIIPSTLSLIELVDRYARDPSVDVEKFERLLAMKERMDARDAEAAFNEAKARIKKLLTGIRFTKTKSGPDNAYRYMPLDKLDEHLAPLLAEESMDLSFTDELLPNGWLLIRGRLKHLPRGHYEDSTMPAPSDTVNKMKSAVQAVGSTNSFLRRYITVNIFNIVVVGDDDDGTGGTIDAAQAKGIRELLKRAHADDPVWATHTLEEFETAFLKKIVHAPSIEEIPFRLYRKATSALEEKLKKEATTS